jgi:hypothetical protein
MAEPMSRPREDRRHGSSPKQIQVVHSVVEVTGLHLDRLDSADPLHSVSGQHVKDAMMHWLKQLPVKESGDSFWAKRPHLYQLAPAASVSKPAFSGKPADGAQNEYSGFPPRDEPPVNRFALNRRTCRTQSPAFSDQASEH